MHDLAMHGLGGGVDGKKALQPKKRDSRGALESREGSEGQR
jgi:hypothetical protein